MTIIFFIKIIKPYRSLVRMDAVHTTFIMLQHNGKVVDFLHLLHNFGVESCKYHMNVHISHLLNKFCQLLQRLIIDYLSIAETDNQRCLSRLDVGLDQILQFLDMWEEAQVADGTSQPVQDIRCSFKWGRCIVFNLDNMGSELTDILIVLICFLFHHLGKCRRFPLPINLHILHQYLSRGSFQQLCNLINW